jgi:MFS family permease
MVTDSQAAIAHFALSVEAAVTVAGGAPEGGAGTRRNDAMTDTERNGAGYAAVPAAPVSPSYPAPAVSGAPDPTTSPDDVPPSASAPLDPTRTAEANPVLDHASVPQPARRDPLPGRVWGIVSLALAVLPLLQLVGLVAGIVGLVLSSRVGRRNWFAVAGIVVSLLLIALAVTLIVLFAFNGYEVFGGSVGSVVTVCSELGPGEHVVDGLTYRCR